MKLFRKIIGISLVIIGIIGCFLPILQGILTITAGLVIWLDWDSLLKLIKRLKNFITYIPARYRSPIIQLIESLEERLGQKEKGGSHSKQISNNY